MGGWVGPRTHTASLHQPETTPWTLVLKVRVSASTASTWPGNMLKIQISGLTESETLGRRPALVSVSPPGLRILRCALSWRASLSPAVKVERLNYYFYKIQIQIIPWNGKTWAPHSTLLSISWVPWNESQNLFGLFPCSSKEKYSDGFMREVVPEAWTGLDDFCGPPVDLVRRIRYACKVAFCSPDFQSTRLETAVSISRMLVKDGVPVQ